MEKAGDLGIEQQLRVEVREDLGQVFALLAEGKITAQVARVFALTEAAGALRYAESGALAGKVILRPEQSPAPSCRTAGRPRGRREMAGPQPRSV